MIEDYLTQSQRPSLDVDSPGSWIQPNIQIGESQVRKPDGHEVIREFDTLLCCTSNAVFKFGLSIYKPTRIRCIQASMSKYTEKLCRFSGYAFYQFINLSLTVRIQTNFPFV